MSRSIPLALIGLWLLAAPATGQTDYPAKPVTVIIPFSTGSASDVVAVAANVMPTPTPRPTVPTRATVAGGAE